jgi:FAD/FMN-containing dehydrogenase
MSRPRVQSWGRFPDFPQSAHAVHWRGEIATTLREVASQFGSTLPFGDGRSYGDSCLAASDHVLDLRSLDRFIAADWGRGALIAEAGVTLEEILELCVPHGWFLPVTPGTKHVTVGGALANDVHGKNHHVRGTFGCHVQQFGLVRSDGGELRCSAEENAELFGATIGGLGLTGIVAWVELQLMPVRSASMQVEEIRFGSLEEFFTLSAELDPKHEYAVSWLDCAARGASVGRGIYSVADHRDDGDLAVARRRKLRVPVAPSRSLINPLTLRAFNALYFRTRRASTRRQVGHEKFLFPLDRLLQWNRLYGARGFQQFQCVLPERNARAASRELLLAISASGKGSVLTVMKRCGAARSPGLLSFPMPGLTVALDFAQDVELSRSLLPRLDTIVREAEGRLYPAKDAHMSGEDFRRAYPDWERVAALRDPALRSRFWERVTAG